MGLAPKFKVELSANDKFSYKIVKIDDDLINKYISDISKMIPETLEYILTTLPPTDILIVDALLPEHPHTVHFNLKQAISLAKQIQPKQHTYLVGMSCDAFPPHDTMNATLTKTKECNISFAHDGLVVEL